MPSAAARPDGFSDLEPASLPPFPGLWAAVGPGLVWLALAQGSGELIFWPYLVAKYGLAFVILLVPAHLMQVPVNTAIGRYTILTGEPIFRGFLRLHRGFAIVLWLWMFVLFLWIGGWASAGGTALAELFGWPASWPAGRRSLLWGYVLMAVFFAALVLGRQTYRLIERFMTVVAVITLGGLLWACSNPVVLSAAPAFLRALVVPGPWPAGQPSWDDWPAREWSFFLTAICFAGLGGFWTLLYSYWIREKGWGLANPARLEGFRLEDTPQNRERFRGWMRALLVDNRIGVMGNLATTLLMCLLSWAILHPQGKAPDRWTIAVAQADFFGSYWAPARMLFLFVAALFLVDAWLAGVDAVSRVHAHMVCELSPAARGKGVRFWYYAFVVFMALASAITMPLGDPATILVASGVVNLAGITVYSVALYVLTARKLRGVMPAWALPRWWESAGLWVSILVYGALGVVYFVQVAWPALF